MTAPLSERVRAAAAALSNAGDALAFGQPARIDLDALERELTSVLDEHLDRHRAEIIRSFARRLARVAGDLAQIERGLTPVHDPAALADTLSSLANSTEALRTLLHRRSPRREGRLMPGRARSTAMRRKEREGARRVQTEERRLKRLRRRAAKAEPAQPRPEQQPAP